MRLSDAALKEKLSFALDGVILGMPPRDQTEKWNFCKYGTEFIWRKPSESFQPELVGDDAYGKQVPQARAIPLWGGCSAGGFAIVDFLYHPPSAAISGGDIPSNSSMALQNILQTHN